MRGTVLNGYMYLSYFLDLEAFISPQDPTWGLVEAFCSFISRFTAHFLVLLSSIQ
jgi:hypothetical protein